MKKSKALRLAGFAGALCTAGALLGTSVASTGAYFTDAKSGTITANSGHLSLSTTDTNLNFADLMPGTDKPADVNYQVAASSGQVDLWLVFDPTSYGYGAFTGNKNTNYNGQTGGGMGRYGHFQVGVNGDVAFRSHNLQLPDSGTANCSDGTVPGANGRGGSDVQSSSSQLCGVPAAIELASNLNSGDTGTVHVVYGLSGKQTQQGQSEVPVGYSIVATQAGHAPTDPNTP